MQQHIQEKRYLLPIDLSLNASQQHLVQPKQAVRGLRTLSTWQSTGTRSAAEVLLNMWSSLSDCRQLALAKQSADAGQKELTRQYEDQVTRPLTRNNDD